MTVFKSYFKILRENKWIIIMYVAILLIFTMFGVTSGSTAEAFSATKPDVAIINYDNSKVTDNLIKFISDNANVVELSNDETTLSDALFYREVNAVIYIYDGYGKDYLNDKEKSLDMSFTTDYQASYMKMIIEKYLNIAGIINNYIKDEARIIDTINNTLNEQIAVDMISSIDNDSLENVAFYYNFANYSVLAICIYCISTVMNTFNEKKIKDRITISSKKSSSYIKELYLANLILTLLVFLFVVLVSIFILGDIVFTKNGLLFIINLLMFSFTALGIGFLIGTLVTNKEAINGIMNVIALGSSFLCGCFVPVDFMPSTIVNMSKVLPSYWFIHNNNIIKGIDSFNFTSLSSVFVNMLIIFGFAFIFFALSIIYNKKRRIN